MAEAVVHFVLQRIREWGIHRVYAYPGDGSTGLGAFDRPARVVLPLAGAIAAAGAVAFTLRR